jgi:FAD/FMN-containing dehydrogenase
MGLIDRLAAAVGPGQVLTGADAARYGRDWTGAYVSAPLAVARPGSTAEVAALVRAAAEAGAAVVPVGGNTGLVGGTMAEGAVMLSLERMNRIRALKPGPRLVVAEAGVILSRIHEAAAAEGLYFPLWFGARGSAMLGGALATNAGGSNVLRYGSARGLCLGLEVVLADGRVLDLMREVHKDNAGYDLRQLFIGSEGTLGIITAAVMRLVPLPAAHATATLAAASVPDALTLLNRLQVATGGAVEAFECMPANYQRRLALIRPDLGLPFADVHEVAILVEVGATAPRDAAPAPDGSVPVVDLLEETVAAMMVEGLILDAVVARTEAQRRRMWERREAAAEITFGRKPFVDTDVAVPLDAVQPFLDAVQARIGLLDPAADMLWVCHLGDGNLHFTVYPATGDKTAILEAIEDAVVGLGGSFSAEHGVGLSKRGTMARRKDPVALDVMRAVKRALDPEGVLNPGKVIPD